MSIATWPRSISSLAICTRASRVSVSWGFALTNPSSLPARLFEQVFPQDEVARPGRLLDQRAAFFVIENSLDIRRLAGIGTQDI